MWYVGTILDRAAGLKNEFETDLKGIMEKAAQSAEPMRGNLRSIIFSARDALEMLQNKYLTKDGQDLLRSVATMAGANFHVNIPDAPAPAKTA